MLRCLWRWRTTQDTNTAGGPAQPPAPAEQHDVAAAHADAPTDNRSCCTRFAHAISTGSSRVWTRTAPARDLLSRAGTSVWDSRPVTATRNVYSYAKARALNCFQHVRPSSRTTQVEPDAKPLHDKPADDPRAIASTPPKTKLQYVQAGIKTAITVGQGIHLAADAVRFFNNEITALEVVKDGVNLVLASGIVQKYNYIGVGATALYTLGAEGPVAAVQGLAISGAYALVPAAVSFGGPVGWTYAGLVAAYTLYTLIPDAQYLYDIATHGSINGGKLQLYKNLDAASTALGFEGWGIAINRAALDIEHDTTIARAQTLFALSKFKALEQLPEPTRVAVTQCAQAKINAKYDAALSYSLGNGDSEIRKAHSFDLIAECSKALVVVGDTATAADGTDL